MTTKSGVWSGAGDGGPPRQKTPFRWLKRLALLAVPLFCLALVGERARAQDVLDPSTLQFGTSSGSFSPSGPGGEVVKIGSSGTFEVANASAGAGALNTPWLLILGIPDTTSTPLTSLPAGLSLTQVNGTTPMGADGYNQTSATFTSSNKDAYAALSLIGDPNASNNFGNWSSYDSTINGITGIQSFGLFEFNINETLDDKIPDTFHFDGLPVGTFLIAYGTTNKNGNNVYNTPFTQSGLTTGPGVLPGPEPSTMALAFSAFGVLGLAWRRLSRRSVVAVS